MRLTSRAICFVLPMACLTGGIANSALAAEIDESPLPVTTALAFPKLKWTGWEPVTEEGLPEPLRPILLTNAGDGSKRIFVAIQQGVVHVFPKEDPQETKVFLNIRPKVVYNDKENEEGLLGMAFHPKYRENGQFFLYYSTTDAPHTTVISRFRVSADDPNRADPNSEQELLRIAHPFWNHKGGTIVFGPDGYLYAVVGDGGKANDPFGNGQNLETLLGKILRIDVDHKDEGKNYALPADNPFVKGPGKARGEIYAYGVRNIWRMAFDPQTGTLWAGDVGQDLWEEIDIIRAGGNYGWNVREGKHPFGLLGSGPRPDLVDPIWEYHHSIGKSITGGHVYRGSRLPALRGAYLYGDYIALKLWALRYDESTGTVTANHTIPSDPLAVISFGEDEEHETYLTIVSPTGKGLYRFVSTAKQGK